MALIDHIDGANRDIYLSAATVGASVHPIDIYKEYRALRASDESLRKFAPFMTAMGNQPKGGGIATERYVVLFSGARLIPYNVSHTLTVVGTIITDDGQSGIACFDRQPLSSTTNVNINYVPPQVEVITITLSGSNVITGSIADIPVPPSASAVAAAVLSAAQTTPIASDVTKVNGIAVTGVGTEADPWGP